MAIQRDDLEPVRLRLLSVVDVLDHVTHSPVQEPEESIGPSARSDGVQPASETADEALRLRILFLMTPPRLAIPSFCRFGHPPPSTRPVTPAPAVCKQIVVFPSMSGTTLSRGTPCGVKIHWSHELTSLRGIVINMISPTYSGSSCLRSLNVSAATW